MTCMFAGFVWLVGVGSRVEFPAAALSRLGWSKQADHMQLHIGPVSMVLQLRRVITEDRRKKTTVQVKWLGKNFTFRKYLFNLTVLSTYNNIAINSTKLIRKNIYFTLLLLCWFRREWQHSDTQQRQQTPQLRRAGLRRRTWLILQCYAGRPHWTARQGASAIMLVAVDCVCDLHSDFEWTGLERTLDCFARDWRLACGYGQKVTEGLWKWMVN